MAANGLSFFERAPETVHSIVLEKPRNQNLWCPVKNQSSVKHLFLFMEGQEQAAIKERDGKFDAKELNLFRVFTELLHDAKNEVEMKSERETFA